MQPSSQAGHLNITNSKDCICLYAVADSDLELVGKGGGFVLLAFPLSAFFGIHKRGPPSLDLPLVWKT